MRIRTIAFEGLDGCGKDTSIEKLSELIHSATWVTPKQIKNERGEVYGNQDGETDELHKFMIQSYRKEWSEIQEKCSQIPANNVLLVNRCWVSHAAIRSSRTQEPPTWPAEFKPDVVFSIRVDEDLRQKRITKRAGGFENLNDREKQLHLDPEFRDGILDAEIELGCIPLRIRNKDPEVVALRALQILLGMDHFEYHGRRDI
mgnify:CR=1 FL=1|jgi:thymidylate kinase